MSCGKISVRSTKYDESLDEFLDWYRWFDLKTRNAGYRPEEGWDEWFNNVQDSHTDIRSIIKGQTASSKVKLEAQQVPLETFQCVWKLNDVRRNTKLSIPLTASDFKIPIRSDGSKISSFIAKETAKKFGENSAEYHGVMKDLSSLGDLWKRNRVDAGELYYTLDTRAKAFLQLGHYEVDEKSCFKQSGTHYDHKFRLALEDNTFVFLIHDINCNNILARMWGFFNCNENVVNFTNLYTKSVSWATAFELCKHQSALLLGSKPSDLNGLENRVVCNYHTDVYINDGFQISFSESKKIKLQELGK